MLGLVLCGGQSVRMGSDKGTLMVSNQTWASLAERKLHALNIPVKFSVNPGQENIYKNLFKKENLIPDTQTLKIGGPLKGILTAHLLIPAEDLFVLACDMIKMDIKIMRKLIIERKEKNDFETYIFSHGNFYEPLCGIYTAGGLAKIAKKYKEGNLKKHSMQSVLDQLSTRQLSLSSTDLRCFKNFNSANELNDL